MIVQDIVFLENVTINPYERIAMHSGHVKVIFVREINDITKDRDDLEAFLLKARDLDVMVYVLNTGVQVKAEPDNGAGC